jgi:hypothetical protein
MAHRSFFHLSSSIVAACLGLFSAHGFAHAAEPTMSPRVKVDEEELSRQLAEVPEIKLGPIGMPKKVLPEMARVTGRNWAVSNFQMTAKFLASRPDLAGLPMRLETERKPDEKHAPDARPLSTADLKAMVKELEKTKETREKIHNLAELSASRRSALIAEIKAMRGSPASQTLAELAVYDLSPGVRADARMALASRPTDEYRDILLSGLRYPWLPAVSNAAEAVVAVEDTKVVPILEKLAEEPDPRMPFTPTRPEDQKLGTQVVRELVRINHLSNCLLCHPQSDTWKPLTPPSGFGPSGVRVPIPGEPLPPPTTRYGAKGGDVFVRTDIKYLRHDFSTMQPVENHGAWPAVQRFDFVTRIRPATEDDLRRKPNPAYRETILHTLAALKNDRPVTQK